MLDANPQEKSKQKVKSEINKPVEYEKTAQIKK